MAKLTDLLPCDHCQGRRDERAMVLSQLRRLQHRTAALLTQSPPMELEPLSELQVRQIVRLLGLMVEMIVKTVRKHPIEHQDVVLDDDTPPTIH